MLTRSAILATTLAIGLVGVLGSSALAVAFVPGNQSGPTQAVQAISVADQDPAVGTSSAFLAGVPAIVQVTAPIALDAPDERANQGTAPDAEAPTTETGSSAPVSGPAPTSTPTPSSSPSGNSGNAGSGNSGNGNSGQSAQDKDKQAKADKKAAEDKAKEDKKAAEDKAKADKKAKEDKAKEDKAKKDKENEAEQAE